VASEEDFSGADISLHPVKRTTLEQISTLQDPTLEQVDIP